MIYSRSLFTKSREIASSSSIRTCAYKLAEDDTRISERFVSNSSRSSSPTEIIFANGKLCTAPQRASKCFSGKPLEVYTRAWTSLLSDCPAREDSVTFTRECRRLFNLSSENNSFRYFSRDSDCTCFRYFFLAFRSRTENLIEKNYRSVNRVMRPFFRRIVHYGIAFSLFLNLRCRVQPIGLITLQELSYASSYRRVKLISGSRLSSWCKFLDGLSA